LCGWCTRPIPLKYDDFPSILLASGGHHPTTTLFCRLLWDGTLLILWLLEYLSCSIIPLLLVFLLFLLHSM
jgi:hypothetical protein